MKESILVVEDDENDAAMATAVFRRLGARFDLQVVSGGKEAVAYLSGGGRYEDRGRYPLPRLVLLDLRMSEMDGFEVLKWIRKHPQHRSLPVVVLAASTYSPDIRRAYAAGANSFVVKPNSLNELTQEISGALDFWLSAAEQKWEGGASRGVGPNFNNS
jgi:CheY-like chemotaxis protein